MYKCSFLTRNWRNILNKNWELLFIHLSKNSKSKFFNLPVFHPLSLSVASLFWGVSLFFLLNFLLLWYRDEDLDARSSSSVKKAARKDWRDTWALLPNTFSFTGRIFLPVKILKVLWKVNVWYFQTLNDFLYNNLIVSQIFLVYSSTYLWLFFCYRLFEYFILTKRSTNILFKNAFKTYSHKFSDFFL